MSASSKKKLRREQEAAKMTEKQLAAQKEAQKTKLYTITFSVVMVIILVIAVTVGVKQTITNSGVMEKKTVAMTVGDHEISNAELNYFYMDAVNSFLSNYGSYAAMFGLDTSLPLNEQYVDEANGITWADDFLTTAKNNATTAYAVADAANAAGYALTEDEITTAEYNIQNIDAYATLYGYASGDAYLKAMYGNGATKESYLEYVKLTALADSYGNHYAEELTYDDAAISAHEAENPGQYDSFSFNSYYLASSKFLTGGTTDENGSTTYSDEEKAASVAAAEETAKALAAGEYASAADLDAAIAALEINKDTTAASTANANTLRPNINSIYADWVADSSRKEGDIAYFENASTSTAEDGTESKTVNGYYVIRYTGTTDNEFPLANVRHILLTPEHSHEEGETHADGETYSAEELSAAKAKAEELLEQWKTAGGTEDSFAALAEENSTDTGSVDNGGLYENIYPGQMVTAFNDWCFDEARKAGDTGIVETEYGYHIMYYVGDSDMSYRDYMITNELRSADFEVWYNEMIEAAAVTEGDTQYIKMDLVLSAA